MRRACLLLALSLAACSDGEPKDSRVAFDAYVTKGRIGFDQDLWIELKNSYGEWERVGLVFGFLDDYGECQKAIAGLKAANKAREYRCAPAN